MKKFILIFISLFFILSVSYTSYSQGMSYHKTESPVSFIPADVLIYPNPVTDNKFFVKSDKLIKKVELMNVLGQNIKTVNNETDYPFNILVKIGNIKKGMYLVQVTLEGGEKIINKIIVK